MRSLRLRSVLILSVIFLLVASSTGFVTAADSGVKSRWLIGFKQTPGNAEHALVRALGGTNLRTLNIAPVIGADLPARAAEALAHNPLVAYVEPNGIVHALSQETPWGILRVQADKVWPTNQGNSVLVAVIDTGVDCDHPDLAGRIHDGKNTIAGADSSNYWDDNGHGTHVAGTILAASNDIGVVGAAYLAKLYAIKVLDAGGSGTWEDVAHGIDAAVSGGAQIINMSLGGGHSPTVETACNNAYNAGVLIVAAAGNSGRPNGSGDTVEYPGKYPTVIAVAATDSTDTRARWSSTGPGVELSAPGVSIKSTYPNDTYATASGTSMASPHVAGVAALLLSATGANNATLRDAMTKTAYDLGADGKDNLYGYGLVDAKAALDYLGGGSTTPTNSTPTCSISEPADGSKVSGQITVAVAASDNEDAPGSLKVTYRVGTGPEVNLSWDGTGLYVGTWDTGLVLDGVQTLTAKATDSGGESKSAAVSVTVANDSTGTTGWTSGDLETGQWTLSGNPAGKLNRKEYFFTPQSSSWSGMTITVEGTKSGVSHDIYLTAYINGVKIGTQAITTSMTSINVVLSRTDLALLKYGQSNSLKLEIGNLLKNETGCIDFVQVDLTAP